MLKAIATSAVFLAAGLAANVVRAEAADPFPDSPENRGAYQRSLATYEAIGHEHSHFAEVNGVRMHYLEWGDGKGMPLIWSHGYSSSAFELSQVGQALADAGFHVFSISYRGHGESQVADYNFSLAHIADDIAAFMKQKKLSCAVIGGLSMGGGVTTTFYENYPERAVAIVLEDGGADAVQLRDERVYEVMKPMLATIAQQQNPFGKRYADRFLVFRDIVRVYLPNWQGEPMPEAVMPIFQSWIRRGEDGLWGMHIDHARLFGEGEAALDPAAGYKLPLLHQSWRRVYPLITYRNLSIPMLIIDPTGDDAGPYGSFSPEYERLRAQHPALVQHVKYPDTNHAAHPRRPEWFVRDMKRLLARVRETGSDVCLYAGKPAK